MITETEEDNFTPHLVSFYPNINLGYLEQNTDNKWYCKQVPVDPGKQLDASNINRGIKTSQTSASLIFYDEEQNNLFSKLPSDEKTHLYPYGFIWNIDNNTNDECIFCPADGCVCDYDFTDKTYFTNCSEYGIDNLYKKYKQDLMKIIYRGKLANIMKFARAQTIDLAKKVYDELKSKLPPNNKIDKHRLNNVMKEMSYYWNDNGCEKVGQKWYYNYSLYEALNGDSHTSSATNIVFHPSTRQMSFNMYNEIAIRSDNSRMYFNNLCVNIEAMNALLNVKHPADNKNIKNFQSFIDACLMTGGKDVVVFRNKNEQDLANDANDKFWLKSSPLIKEKITFLEFIDKYCEKFKQYFTKEQKQKIEELRKKKNNIELKEKLETTNQSRSQKTQQNGSQLLNESINSKNTTKNSVSLFGLGCYEITKQAKDGHSCSYCFW